MESIKVKLHLFDQIIAKAILWVQIQRRYIKVEQSSLAEESWWKNLFFNLSVLRQQKHQPDEHERTESPGGLNLDFNLQFLV